MNFFKSILLSLVLVASSFAEVPPLIREYMRENSNVWNSGLVCRHAVTALADMAKDDRLIYLIPIFDTNDPKGEKHVLFMVNYAEKWYGIDAHIYADGKYRSACYTYNKMPTRVADYEKWSRRGLTAIRGYAKESLVDVWRKQKDAKGRVTSEIDVQIEKISLMKKYIKKVQEFVAVMVDNLAEYRKRLEANKGP